MNPTTKQWTNAGNFPENKYAADAVVLNEQGVCHCRKKTGSGLLQQSLRRRSERLRGGRLRLVPQGRQCLRGYAPRSGGSCGWIGDYCEAGS